MRSNVSLIIFVLSTCLFAFAFSTTVMKKSSHGKMVQLLEKMEVKSLFGRNLLSVVQLKLRTGDDLDGVYNLLDELVSNLQSQQNDADSDHSDKNYQWNNEIANYTADVASSHQAGIDEQAHLIDVSQQQVDAQNNLATLTANLNQAQDSLSAVTTQWDAYTATYEKNQDERKRVLSVLGQISDQLTARLNSASFVQIKDLIRTLKEVGQEKNSIASLVELTMSFNPQAVQNVLDKIAAIVDGLNKAIAEDDTNYSNAQTNYQTTTGQLNDLISSLTDQISSVNTFISANAREIDDSTERLANDQAAEANYQSLLDADVASQTAYNKQYDDETAIRNEEVAVIQQVEQILKNNESNLRQQSGTASSD